LFGVGRTEDRGQRIPELIRLSRVVDELRVPEGALFLAVD